MKLGLGCVCAIAIAGCGGAQNQNAPAQAPPTTTTTAPPAPSETAASDPPAGDLPPRAPSDAPAEPPTASGVSFSGGDGSSCEKAVVVHAQNEQTGVPAEYEWLGRHYPGYHTKSQALIKCGDRPADELSIVTGDGKTISVFFDIADYFGKM